MSHQNAPIRLKDRLLDPGDMRCIGEVWDAIKDIDAPLQVRLRTDDTLFGDVPVLIRWVHGRHRWQSKSQPEQHKLLFDIPDEVWLHVQSRYARHFERKLFGRSSDSTLSQPIRSEREVYKVGEGFFMEAITDDWPKLREAFERCANDQPDLSICFEGNATGKALIAENRIEISIVSMLDQIIDNWRSELRRMIGTRVSAGIY